VRVLRGESRSEEPSPSVPLSQSSSQSMLHRSGLAGVTDVHCITNGRTFHLQKKKVHNKSSDLSSNHPAVPASRLWESTENEISLRRDAMRRGISRAFKIQKEPPPRRSTSGERGWMVSTEGPRRKVGQGKSVRA